MRTIREYVYDNSPPWLQKYLGWDPRFPYLLGAQMDNSLDAMTQGVKARFPGVGTRDALPLIGRDRGIIRGPAEGNLPYSQRLRRWLDTWRIAGSPFAIMEAIRGYVYPNKVRLRVVSDRGDWFTWDENDVKSFYRPGTNNWIWDGDTYGEGGDQKWFRYWVIVYPLGLWNEPQNWGDADLWGNGKWGNPGQVWGASGITENDIASLETIIRQWGPAGPHCSHFLICFDPDAFDPTGSGSGYPDGTWDDPTNRSDDASYYPIDGSP